MTDKLDFKVAPGEYISELLEIKNMTQVELARRLSVSPKHISKIVNSEAGISPDLAVGLENVFGRPADYWLRLQTAFDEFTSREKIEADLLANKEWIDLFDYPSLIKSEMVTPTKKYIEKGKNLLKFFEISDPLAWNEAWLNPVEQICCRGSESVNSHANLIAIARLSTWIRQGQIVAERDISESFPRFDKEKLNESLLDLRALNTVIEPKLVFPKLQSILAKSGVYFQVLKEQKLMKTYAATFRIEQNRAACLQLSLRGKSHDQFWFSLFHEIYHLLNSGRAQGSLIGQSRNADVEREADRFAGNTLIPPDEYSSFVNLRDFSHAAILSFTKRINLHPGILVGRLQHDKFIEYSEHNGLKIRYYWEASQNNI